MSTNEHARRELCEAIDATRRELGATVEALAAKTAVKTRVRHRVEYLKDDLKHIAASRPVRVAAIVGAAIAVLIGSTLLVRTD